jgi:ribosomal protein S18 acetylase RimI-like enzyme
VITVTITIRPATREDVPAIVRLLADDALGSRRELVEDPVAPVYLRAFDEMANQAANELLVAVKGDEVVGCLQLTIVTGLSRRGIRRAQLEGVRVSSKHRGEKVGEQLVQYAIARAREAGCGLMQLTSDVSRLDARRFYEKLGFKATHIGMKLPLTPTKAD